MILSLPSEPLRYRWVRTILHLSHKIHRSSYINLEFILVKRFLPICSKTFLLRFIQYHTFANGKMTLFFVQYVVMSKLKYDNLFCLFFDCQCLSSLEWIFHEIQIKLKPKTFANTFMFYMNQQTRHWRYTSYLKQNVPCSTFLYVYCALI